MCSAAVKTRGRLLSNIYQFLSRSSGASQFQQVRGCSDEGLQHYCTTRKVIFFFVVVVGWRCGGISTKGMRARTDIWEQYVTCARGDIEKKKEKKIPHLDVCGI